MPYKNKEERLAYHKEYARKHTDKSKAYYLKNRERILLLKKEYGEKNRKLRKKYNNKIKLASPWRSSYFNAKNRCTNKNGQDYHTYGARGIKFLLSMEEMKSIWFRDKAYKMKRPSIDRINNDGNYEFLNCRFIEGSENATKGNYESRWK